MGESRAVRRPLPLLDVAISLHIEESRRFVYAQKLARPTAPCYNNEWLVRSISRGYPSTSLHQADPTYFNCPSATTNPTHRPIPFSTEAISSSLTLDRSGSYQARPNYPRAEGRKKPNVTGCLTVQEQDEAVALGVSALINQPI